MIVRRFGMDEEFTLRFIGHEDVVSRLEADVQGREPLHIWLQKLATGIEIGVPLLKLDMAI
jgi:hypothetical protein